MNHNINNNLQPSPSSGFSKFIAEPESSQRRFDDDRFDPSGPGLERSTFGERMGGDESYVRETEDVAVVETGAGGEHVLEEIDKDVRSIKERISTLHELMQSELEPTDQFDEGAMNQPQSEKTSSYSRQDEHVRQPSFERESAEGEQPRDQVESSGFRPMDRDREGLFGADAGQRHSYAGRQLQNQLNSLPPRHSIAHLGSREAREEVTMPLQQRDVQAPMYAQPQLAPQQSDHIYMNDSLARRALNRQEMEQNMNASRQRNIYTRQDSSSSYQRSNYSRQESNPSLLRISPAPTQQLATKAQHSPSWK